jgi:hypothetical protein
MIIEIKDNIITVNTPSNDSFRIKVGVDHLYILGKKANTDFPNDKHIITIKTIDTDEVRVGVI